LPSERTCLQPQFRRPWAYSEGESSGKGELVSAIEHNCNPVGELLRCCALGSHNPILTLGRPAPLRNLLGRGPPRPDERSDVRGRRTICERSPGFR